jgi:GT2 family glycosyltransferase
MVMPELSIIFVNWNATDYMRSCLNSIYSQASGVDFEVIVVDNASLNGNVDSLKQEFPGIRLIKSRENIGFAGANNLGYKQSTGDCLLFLNPDTEVIGPAIQRMLKRMNSLYRPGAVGCKLLNSDGSIQTSCIQRFPTILNQILDIEALRIRWPGCSLWKIDALFSGNEEPTEVEVISGACLMIRREVFEAVNLFSKDYFMYAEDVDLCFKVHQAGFKNYFLGEATVLHHGGGSSKQKSSDHWSAIAQREALQLLCRKMYGPAYAWMFRAAMAVSAVVRLALVFPVFLVGTMSARHVNPTWRKWVAVLRWSIGIESTNLTPNSKV